MKQLRPKSKRYTDRNKKSRCQDELPCRQEFPVVSARIGQAKGQPESRQERPRRENERLPIGDLLGHCDACRLIPPNALSTASVAIPAKKHQLANERRLRKRAATAKAPLKSAAAKASKELDVTTRRRMSESESEVRVEVRCRKSGKNWAL